MLPLKPILRMRCSTSQAIVGPPSLSSSSSPVYPPLLAAGVRPTGLPPPLLAPFAVYDWSSWVYWLDASSSKPQPRYCARMASSNNMKNSTRSNKFSHHVSRFPP